MKANDLSMFNFELVSSGCYKVTYTTPKRGDYYVAMINDMSLTDRTYRAEWAKAKDIEWLRRKVIERGSHYGKNGNRLENKRFSRIHVLDESAYEKKIKQIATMSKKERRAYLKSIYGF